MSSGQLARDILDLAQIEAREHRAQLTAEFEDGLPDIDAEPIQLQQVALNLIRNAVEASASQPGARSCALQSSVWGPDKSSSGLPTMGLACRRLTGHNFFIPFHDQKRGWVWTHSVSVDRAFTWRRDRLRTWWAGWWPILFQAASKGSLIDPSDQKTGALSRRNGGVWKEQVNRPVSDGIGLLLIAADTHSSLELGKVGNVIVHVQRKGFTVLMSSSDTSKSKATSESLYIRSVLHYPKEGL